ncbi:MAG: T9SS type A sorting domain-containing protein [Balneolaceae bacterium]
MLKLILRFAACLVLILSFVAVQSGFAQEMVLRMDFEESLTDSSELGNVAEASGDPLYDDDAIIGSSSLRFDGEDDYIEIPGTNLALEEFTLDFFIKPGEESLSGGNVFISKWADANPTNEDGEWFWRGNYEVRFHNNPEGSFASSSWDRSIGEEGGRAWLSPTLPGSEDAFSPNADEWYNVIYLSNADTTILQVRNTVGDVLAEAGRAPLGEIATDPGQPLRIGWAHHVNMGTASPWLYTGLMDDLRIYDYARLDEEGNYIDPRAEAVSSEMEPDAPGKINLAQNYPNPFNPSTNIEFSIPQSGHVSLSVYDVIGKEVALLVDGSRSSGAHNVTFNAENLPSGIYYYRLETEAGNVVKSMTLIK